MVNLRSPVQNKVHSLCLQNTVQKTCKKSESMLQYISNKCSKGLVYSLPICTSGYLHNVSVPAVTIPHALRQDSFYTHITNINLPCLTRSLQGKLFSFPIAIAIYIYVYFILCNFTFTGQVEDPDLSDLSDLSDPVLMPELPDPEPLESTGQAVLSPTPTPTPSTSTQSNLPELPDSEPPESACPDASSVISSAYFIPCDLTGQVTSSSSTCPDASPVASSKYFIPCDLTHPTQYYLPNKQLHQPKYFIPSNSFILSYNKRDNSTYQRKKVFSTNTRNETPFLNLSLLQKVHSLYFALPIITILSPANDNGASQ